MNATEEHYFTDEQRVIYNRIVGAVETQTPLYLFVSARGGCGKTYLLNAVLMRVRSLDAGGCVALAMATTGIAAVLLENGRTFHSRMKAPLNPTEESMLRIPAQSELAKLVRMAKLLIVDEATMLDNRLLAALDRSLCDLMNSDRPLGGKIIVLSGDFRQCLPVVPRASRAGIVEICINQSPLWRHFEVMELSQNMRVRACGNPELIRWDKWTQSVGNGLEGEVVRVPEDLVKVLSINKNTAKENWHETKSLKKLIEVVFPNLAEELRTRGVKEWLGWLEGRAILTPWNKMVDAVNDLMVSGLKRPEIILCSADQMDDCRDSQNFSLEHLNSLNPTGLPRHRLVIKKGVPLMLLRNLEPKKSLCNGTRLIFKDMSANNRLMICYTGRMVRGQPEEVAIPRIILRPKEKEYPFDWSRRQFPVRVAFACTVNKSQGQSMKQVGLWLPHSVFGHGQLYVAISRCGDNKNITIAHRPEDKKSSNSLLNVVYKEVLLKPGTEEAEYNPPPADTDLASMMEDDMNDWMDSDGLLDAESSEDLVDEEELGTPQAGLIKRVVERPVPRSRRPSSRATPPPVFNPHIMDPLPEVPMSEYEEMRAQNIQRRQKMFDYIYGDEDISDKEQANR